MKLFLSVCLIVKNEEKVLRRCLESVKGIADEIIVADTGSTDKTKEIALEYADKVCDYRWENDFSKARNFAASKASGKWIIAIDADEYVDRDEFGKFYDELKKSPSDTNIFAVQIVNFVGSNGKDTVLNYHERIYKNDGEISYYRNIHEMLKHKQSLEKRGFAQLQIYHSGYMVDVVKEKDKSKRNLMLLEKKKEKDAIDYYFLGNEYFQLGNWDKAIWYYKEGYRLKKNIDYDWVKKLLVRLVNCLHLASRNKEAFEIASASEEVFNHLVDFKFLKGKIYLNDGKTKEAINIFKEILLKKNELKADSSTDYLEYLPHKHLGELYEKENELQLAVHHYSRALSLNDFDDQVWAKLIRLLGKNCNEQEFDYFIKNSVLMRENMSAVRLTKILLKIEDIGIQKYSRIFLASQGLGATEKKALELKCNFLDGNYNEVAREINLLSPDQFMKLISHGIFHINDFIILALENNEETYKEILLNIHYDVPIVNLLNLLFVKSLESLSVFEKEMYVKILNQANLIGAKNSICILKNKQRYL